MKFLFFSLVLFFCNSSTFGQTVEETSDRFQKSYAYNINADDYQQLTDTIIFFELHNASQLALKNNEFDQATQLAKEANTLATNLNYKSGIAESLFLMAEIKFHEGLVAAEDKKTTLYAQAQNKYLESLKAFERLNDDHRSADVCLQIGLLYKEWGEFHENAINYFKKALALYPAEDVTSRIVVLKEISNSYSTLKKYEIAIEYQLQLLSLSILLQDDREALNVRRDISASYHELNKYEDALYQELEILKIKKKIQDSIGIVNSYNNLGFIHKHLKRYKEALGYFKKCLELTKKYNTNQQPTLMEKTVLMNIGIIYQNLRDYENSNKSFYSALSIWVAVGKPEEIAKIYKKIAQNNIELGELETARNNLRQALSTAKNSRDDQFIASINKELSEIYQRLGDDANALKCYQLYAEANDRFLMEQNKRQELLLAQQYKIELFEKDKKLAIAEKVVKEIELENKLENKNSENELLKQEGELLRKKEELQKVLLQKEQADKIKTQQELKIIEQQYEIEKKNKDNKLLQQRDSIRSLEVDKIALQEKQQEQQLDLLQEKANNQQLILDEQRAREGFFIGIFIALAIIVFLAMRSYLVKKKANNILAAQNKEIQNQRDQLEKSYQNLKKLSEIGKNITSNLSVERIIETVFRNVSPLMDASVFGVGLFNEKSNTLEFPGLKENGETIIMISIPLEDNRQLAVKCYKNKKTLFINDFQNEFQKYIKEIPPSVTGKHASSILYIPLVVKEKAIGVITVQSFEKFAYTEYHLNILRNLAVHTAIALENANNFGQIKDKTIKLEQTLKDLKSAQSQLIQSEKMASLGQLTAGIAHEINNPINFVYAGIDGLNTSLEALLEILNKYEEIEDYHGVDSVINILKEINQLKQKVYFDETKASIHDLINAIKDGAHRTAEIVEGLRNFSRINETDLKKVNLHKGIESSLVLLNNKINLHKIKVIKDFDLTIPEINCYPGQLNQVYMNLIGNAIDAIEEDGEIKIKTRLDDDQVCIEITDSGSGIEPEVIEKIFDPFFTTKDLGKGTGLGLSISFGIIEKHKGKLEVISQKHQGSTFIIYLPTDLNIQPRRKTEYFSNVNA